MVKVITASITWQAYFRSFTTGLVDDFPGFYDHIPCPNLNLSSINYKVEETIITLSRHPMYIIHSF